MSFVLPTYFELESGLDPADELPPGLHPNHVTCVGCSLSKHKALMIDARTWPSALTVNGAVKWVCDGCWTMMARDAIPLDDGSGRLFSESVMMELLNAPQVDIDIIEAIQTAFAAKTADQDTVDGHDPTS